MEMTVNVKFKKPEEECEEGGEGEIQVLRWKLRDSFYKEA